MTTTTATLLTWQPTARTTTRKVGKWSVEVYPNGNRDIRHYSTVMLCVSPTGDVLAHSTGHGSVSDQGMMNKLFRALGSNLYFSRKGGASIG